MCPHRRSGFWLQWSWGGLALLWAGAGPRAGGGTASKSWSHAPCGHSRVWGWHAEPSLHLPGFLRHPHFQPAGVCAMCPSCPGPEQAPHTLGNTPRPAPRPEQGRGRGVQLWGELMISSGGPGSSGCPRLGAGELEGEGCGGPAASRRPLSCCCQAEKDLALGLLGGGEPGCV